MICRVVNLLQEKMQVKVRDKPEKKKVFPKCPCCKVGFAEKLKLQYKIKCDF